MKRICFICLVLLSAKAYAQDSNKSFAQGILQRIDFGIKAGANYSNFTNASFATDPLIGFHAGASVAFNITKNFSIQEDFLFSTEGAKNKSNEFGKADFKLYYISVPILLRYKTNAGFYVEAGTQVGMKAKEDIAGLTANEFAKKIDFAAVGGIGYQSKIGLGIGARYIYGLSKIGNFDPSNIRNDFKNNNVQVSIFYVF
jgi:hypothetical protein